VSKKEEEAMITQDVLKQLAEDLKQFARTETIFGQPITIEGSTIIPVCKVSIGYGSGGGEGEGGAGQKGAGKGTGSGGGGGVKVEPSALVIVKDGDVSVVTISSKGAKFEALLEKLPLAIEKLKAKSSKPNSEPAS